MRQVITPRWATITLALLVAAAAELALGRAWWCPMGDWAFSSWDIWSRHNSQHFLDPYSFTHVSHGLLFFFLTQRRGAFSFPVAIIIESLWEIAENTPFIIDRYRTVTISLDYYGDSIINSLADIGCCAVGFLIAERLNWRERIWMLLLIELSLVLAIKDSLLLNIIMLIHPVEAIRIWQTSV